ncbi:MAG: OsmC family protein [Chloroflexi bacterium]|nr:OsmC family protein [Chloroflexota bacterium]
MGRAIRGRGAPGVGGAGTAACSGDLLLGALAAWAQLTCQLVAANMGLEGVAVSVEVEGDLDLRGTLGTPDVPVGFEAIRCVRSRGRTSRPPRGLYHARHGPCLGPAP